MAVNPNRRGKVLIVDGYNVLRSTNAYKALSGDDFSDGMGLNPARERLIADVATFAQREYDATIVFDGGGNPESDGSVRTVAGISVVFSPAGTEADQVVEKVAHDASARGREVLVVTSDSTTQWTVLGAHVTRMSAASFLQEISAADASWREKTPAPPMKRTLSERVPGDVAETLARWARGEIPS